MKRLMIIASILAVVVGIPAIGYMVNRLHPRAVAAETVQTSPCRHNLSELARADWRAFQSCQNLARIEAESRPVPSAAIFDVLFGSPGDIYTDENTQFTPCKRDLTTLDYYEIQKCSAMADATAASVYESING